MFGSCLRLCIISGSIYVFSSLFQPGTRSLFTLLILFESHEDPPRPSTVKHLHPRFETEETEDILSVSSQTTQLVREGRLFCEGLECVIDPLAHFGGMTIKDDKERALVVDYPSFWKT